MRDGTDTARRALVVEGNRSVAGGCGHVLEGKGYEVEIASSGDEGVARAVVHDIDLVVTDLDTTDFVHAIRRARPRATIVMIPKYERVRTAVAATRAAVSAYLPESRASQGSAGVDSEEARRAADKEAETSLIREVLRRASSDRDFGRRLLEQGSQAIADLPLSAEAKTAIVWADTGWLKDRCGELRADESVWLQHRLEAEIW